MREVAVGMRRLIEVEVLWQEEDGGDVGDDHRLVHEYSHLKYFVLLAQLSIHV